MRGRPLQSVAIQAKSCTAVGIATSMLAAEKKICARCGMPTANMWCTHRPKLTKPIAIRLATIQSRPTSGRRAKLGIMVETMPAAGRKMM